MAVEVSKLILSGPGIPIVIHELSFVKSTESVSLDGYHDMVVLKEQRVRIQDRHFTTKYGFGQDRH